MPRRAWMLGAPAALAMPTQAHAQELTKTASRFEKPIKVKLGEKKVAPGLEECLLADMNIGGTRRCKLPAKLAYGSTGYPKSGEKAGSIIPPNADVYFQVRLRSVVLSKGLGFGLNVI